MGESLHGSESARASAHSVPYRRQRVADLVTHRELRHSRRGRWRFEPKQLHLIPVCVQDVSETDTHHRSILAPCALDLVEQPGRRTGAEVRIESPGQYDKLVVPAPSLGEEPFSSIGELLGMLLRVVQELEPLPTGQGHLGLHQAHQLAAQAVVADQCRQLFRPGRERSIRVDRGAEVCERRPRALLEVADSAGSIAASRCH